MDSISTFHLRTYGCQMNELDSEVIHGILIKRGLTPLEDEMEADLIIFNTCSIRDLAERKVLGKLGQLNRARKKKPIIGVMGCMASSKKETLFQKAPFIDFVLGTNNIHELNSVLDALLETHSKQMKADPRFSHELDYSLAARTNPIQAFVSIIRGCNKHCTYCVVPYTRGPEVSRHPSEIVSECQRLIDSGYKEITLLGQNVNSFGIDHPEWKCHFHDLLEQVDRFAKNKCRIRFMTSHPVDITDELMYAIRDLSSVCEFVHFPLQAGSDRILKKMNRRYTLQEYLDKVSHLRSIVPNVSLGTDIIVGFPTETDAEFQETVKAFEAIRFSVSFLFAYSPRKGTPSFRFGDDVPSHIKDERLQTLLAMQERIAHEEQTSMLNSTVEVLVEGTTSKEDSMLKGRTRGWKNVVFQGPSSLVGTFQRVHLESWSHQTLLGKIHANS